MEAFPPTVTKMSLYHGSCDASGVVDIGQGHFASATDERNAVRVFAVEGDGQSVAMLSLDAFLDAKWSEKVQAYKECDIESATRIGDVTLWITSHGRNTEAKERPERQRFFALRIVSTERGPALEPYGKPYAGLLGDLVGADLLKDWGLSEAAKKAPQEKGGLNIEAICATPHGGVWVGFRNPIREGKALLVKIGNPLALVEGKDSHARIEKVRALDLGGRGVRDMTPWKDGYLILAGAYDDERKFALYRWEGSDATPEMLPVDLNATGLSPEGLVGFPDEPGKVLVLSDDDSVKIDGVENKTLPDDRRTFRGMWITLGK
jgi:hypothetical protein